MMMVVVVALFTALLTWTIQQRCPPEHLSNSKSDSIVCVAIGM